MLRIILASLKDGLFVGGTAFYFDVLYNENGEPIFENGRTYVGVWHFVPNFSTFFFYLTFTTYTCSNY